MLKIQKSCFLKIISPKKFKTVIRIDSTPWNLVPCAIKYFVQKDNTFHIKP